MHIYLYKINNYIAGVVFTLTVQCIIFYWAQGELLKIKQNKG